MTKDETDPDIEFDSKLEQSLRRIVPALFEEPEGAPAKGPVAEGDPKPVAHRRPQDTEDAMYALVTALTKGLRAEATENATRPATPATPTAKKGSFWGSEDD